MAVANLGLSNNPANAWHSVSDVWCPKHLLRLVIRGSLSQGFVIACEYCYVL